MYVNTYIYIYTCIYLCTHTYTLYIVYVYVCVCLKNCLLDLTEAITRRILPLSDYNSN